MQAIKLLVYFSPRCRPSYDWMRVISVRNPSMRTNRKVSLVFNHLEPGELANHLTFLEYKIFRRLNFADLKSYALSGQLKDNLKLERSIGLFNGLSLWIQCMILSRHTPKQRAEVITKFVEVSKVSEPSKIIAIFPYCYFSCTLLPPFVNRLCKSRACSNNGTLKVHEFVFFTH